VSTQHEEFPELAQQAQAAYRAGCQAGPLSLHPLTKPVRRFLAAFLRETMKQVSGHDLLHVGDLDLWNELQAIACNLHNPPPPPILTQAREADLDTPEGRDLVRAFLATLREGGQP